MVRNISMVPVVSVVASLKRAELLVGALGHTGVTNAENQPPDVGQARLVAPEIMVRQGPPNQLV